MNEGRDILLSNFKRGFLVNRPAGGLPLCRIHKNLRAIRSVLKEMEIG